MDIKRYDLLNSFGNDALDLIIDNDLDDVVKYSEAKGIIEEFRKIAKDNADWYDCLRIDFKELEKECNYLKEDKIPPLEIECNLKQEEIKKLREAIINLEWQIEEIEESKNI